MTTSPAPDPDVASGPATASGPADPFLESAVGRQLQQGFPWLRFEPALEGEFRRELYLDTRQQLRLNLGMGVGLVVAISAMDRMAMPPEALAAATTLRQYVLVPVLLACLGVTFLRDGARWYPRLATLLAPLAMLAVVAIELAASTSGSHLHFATLVLASIFLYYLGGLFFYGATFANAVGIVAYAAGGAAVGIPDHELRYNTLMLLFAGLIGATVAYNLEMARRTGWLEARLLGELALRDGLTGIFNRRRLDEHLERVWQQGARELRPLAIIMVDIDFFKPYNDRYGHQAGDEVLKAVAGVMARCARRPLDFVARYGGEEFVVVLYDASPDYAADLARRINAGVAALALPHADSPIAAWVTVSAGVAFAQPTAGRSPEGLLQLADEALYTAKNTGRDRVQVMDAEYAQLRTGDFQRPRKSGT